MSDSEDNAAPAEPSPYHENYENHYFHDAVLEGIAVLPPTEREMASQVEVRLSFPQVPLRFVVTFTGCTNIALALDSDVLADNLPENTMGLKQACDEEAEATDLRAFILGQVVDWNVKYGDTGSPDPGCFKSGPSPLVSKLARVDTLRLHRLHFFGGKLTVASSGLSIQKM